ncbi:MAG: aminoglycoside phosphotransferase family protein [Pseudomonadota bacterium]
MKQYITNAQEISPAVLSALLDRQISQVELSKTGETLNGAFAHVTADGEMLFIKWTKPKSYSKRKAYFNQREVWFYQTLDTSDIPVPHCFFAHADEAGASTIILEDISHSHSAWAEDTPNWEIQCIDTLASLHSKLWNDPRLELIQQGQPDINIEAWRKNLHPRVQGMADELGVADAAELHALVDHPMWEKYMQRAKRAPQTLLHSDTHRMNFLHSEHGAILIDWELLQSGVPANDLMQFVIFNCPSKQDELIKRYKAQTHYSLDEFNADWKTSVCLSPLYVSAFWQNGVCGERLETLFECSMRATRKVLET